MTQPDVVVVVLNWCGEDDTAACLESLRASRYSALTTLLVDNASPDGSGDRLHARFPDIPYLQTEENLGYTGGNNRGFAWALERDAEYVLVLNNDTVVDPDCIASLVAAAQQQPHGVRVGAVAPKILYHDAPDRLWYAGGDYLPGRAMGRHRREAELDVDGPTRIEEITFVTGCCFLIPASVLRAVGGFAEEYFAYVEDVELSLRIRRAGYTLLYQPTARLWHRVSPERRDPTPFQIVQRDRNRRRLANAHFGPAAALRFRLWYYPTRAVRLMQYAVARDWPRARAVWDGATQSLDGTAR